MIHPARLRSRAFALSWLLSCCAMLSSASGCDPEPEAEPDASIEDASVPDGGTSCVADDDCDDATFCNGAERCAPSDATADSFGCVAGDPPCPADGCHEPSDTCACGPGQADRDGDGDRSIGCGGGDCDDEDPRRSSGAVEICDTLGLDEDCDPTSLHNASNPASPGDIDGDGFVDVMCANIDADGELVTGDDCDDGEPGVHPGADERCNGADDDCDEAIDEDFECVQSETVTADNACGRSAMRSCSSECGWVEAGFFREESAATCDYCADSEDGLEAEKSFATGSEMEDLRGGVLVGDAMCPPLSLFCGEGGDYPHVIDGSAADQAGGVFPRATEIVLGYEAITLSVVVEATAMGSGISGGWGLVAYYDHAPGSVGAGADLGIDTARAGLSFEWDWIDGDDMVRFRHLDPAGDDPVVDERRPAENLVAGMTVSQDARLTIQPDDPATTDVDETRFIGSVSCPSDECIVPVVDPQSSVGCANDLSGFPDCGSTLRPGTALQIGVVAASESAPMQARLPEGVLVRSGLCP